MDKWRHSSAWLWLGLVPCPQVEPSYCEPKRARHSARRNHQPHPQDSHMVPIMLAVARWCSGNHSAASLAGEKMTRVWARAQRLCPLMRKANGSWTLTSMQGTERSTLPAKFSHAHRTVCGGGVRSTAWPADSPPNTWPLPTAPGILPGDPGQGRKPTLRDPTLFPRGPCVGSDSQPSAAQWSPETRWLPHQTGWTPQGRPLRAS